MIRAYRGQSLEPARLPGILFLIGLLATASVSAADRPDVLVADFEGTTYGGWIAAGDAFGTGPARGSLPGQMAVTGFLGHGLVNSFHQGDGATGRLTSPPFPIERSYLNFLIGGGRNPGRTCIDLLVDGKVVRTATGPNDKPGGTEQLDWAAWDVQEFQGRTGVIQIVDQVTGGWGHINIDQIVQSDRRQGNQVVQRMMVANARYLHLPVRQDAPSRRLRVVSQRPGLVRRRISPLLST